MIELIKQIGEWQAATFPNATLAGAEAHLDAERGELAEEMADYVFMRIQKDRMMGGINAQSTFRNLLPIFGAAFIFGIDLERALVAKLTKNMLRTWPTTPNADGYFEHVKEG